MSRIVSAAYCLVPFAAAPLAAQAGPGLWLDDLLPRSSWSEPRPPAGLSAAHDLLEPVPHLVVSASARARRIGFGPFVLHRHEARTTLLQPLDSPDLTVDFTASHRVGSHLDLDRGALRDDVPSAVEAGVTGDVESWPGRWALRMGGGWEGGARWSATVAGASRFLLLTASHMSAQDGRLRLSLPGSGMEGRNRSVSSRTAAGAELRWPGDRFHGSRLAVEWARESFEPGERAGPTVLEAGFAGAGEMLAVESRIQVLDPVRFEVGFRRARIGADGSLARDGQRAGRLFFGRISTDRWTVALAEPSDEAGWRGLVSWGRAAGSLSARLETWPFRDIWDQLGAVAYRVRGEVETRWTAAGWSRRAPDGTGWTLGIERVRVGLDGEDWLVTGLGFGRSDRRRLEDLEATVLLLGADLRLGLPGTEGRGSVRLSGSVPVRASWNRAAQERLAGRGWASGGTRWADVGVSVSWSSGPS